MRRCLLGLLCLMTACGPAHRVRRVLAPEAFVTAEHPPGDLANVVVSTGYAKESPHPFLPPAAFAHEGQQWFEPEVVTDRGWVEIQPQRPDASVRVWQRPTGLRSSPFEPVVSLSGSLRRRLPTAIQWLPTDPLGEAPLRLHLSDLQNLHRGRPLADGDLLLIEVLAPDAPTERYLLQTRRFGLRARIGSGLVVPLGIKLGPGQVPLSPAVTVSTIVGYRPRTRRRGLEFLSERFGLVLSAGVTSSVLRPAAGDLQTQARRVLDAGVLGGGIEAFELVSIQLLRTFPTRMAVDGESAWVLGAGLDPVQLGRFLGRAAAQIAADHPLEAER